jgi:hypothetical protein
VRLDAVTVRASNDALCDLGNHAVQGISVAGEDRYGSSLAFGIHVIELECADICHATVDTRVAK